MIGDTNLFLADQEEEKLAEIDIMIADSRFRRKQRGREATLLMLKYGQLDVKWRFNKKPFITVTWLLILVICIGVEDLGIQRFEAKIGLDNEASIRLFQQLTFKETSRSEIFQEVTLSSDPLLFVHLQDRVTHYTVSKHWKHEIFTLSLL